MDLYKSILRPILFKLDPERAHHLTLSALRLAHKFGITRLMTPKNAFNRPEGPIEVMGLKFPNRVGLAAGLDKAGDRIAPLGALGFGHIEVGTITPRPQSGNPKPRLFRLPEHEAIINRMGFNNPGIDQAIVNIRKSRKGYQGIVGVNIGKNADTPIENAADDYLACLRKAYPIADYIACNLSSPNTKNLRDLQNEENARDLLSKLKTAQAELADEHSRYVPIAIKIAPDLDEEQIGTLAKLFNEFEIDAVIATNTTISREEVAGHRHADEKGGLSGAPLTEISARIADSVRTRLSQDIPVVGVGGIMCRQDASDRMASGSSLIQLYSGFVYRGMTLVSECL